MEKPPKPFTIRLSKEMWVFLKEQAIKQETSSNQILKTLLDKYKKRCEKSVDGK